MVSLWKPIEEQNQREPVRVPDGAVAVSDQNDSRLISGLFSGLIGAAGALTRRS